LSKKAGKGILNKRHASFQECVDKELKNPEGDIEVLEKYAKLKFYCGKDEIEGCCLTHLIGLPQHPHTHEAMRFMLHQNNFCQQMMKKGQRKIHVNKSRQIGYTEIVLRAIQYLCFNKYAGGHVRFITGVRLETAKLLMARFRILFDNIREVVLDDNDLEMTLVNGTHILALPSTSGAIRGDTKINCIFIDEAAHFERIDDSIVMDAIHPIVFTNKSDIVMITTPNGPRGFFYKIDKEKTDYHYIKENIYSGVPNIYTREEAEKELERTDIDVDQEYLNQYTTGKDSIFGSVLAEEIGDFDTLE